MPINYRAPLSPPLPLQDPRAGVAGPQQPDPPIAPAPFGSAVPHAAVPLMPRIPNTPGIPAPPPLAPPAPVGTSTLPPDLLPGQAPVPAPVGAAAPQDALRDAIRAKLRTAGTPGAV
jgi:hypothetical protein